MEEGKKQVGAVGKSEEGKPPTRLQMHAPASIELDQEKANTETPKPAAATPIPLLTRLASPHLFPQTDEFVFPTDDSHRKAASVAIPFPTAFAWKEPGGAGHVEISTQLALFQNRCVIVNDAQ